MKHYLIAILLVATLAACSHNAPSTSAPQKAVGAGSAAPGSGNIPVTVMNPNGTSSTTTNTVYAPK